MSSVKSSQEFHVGTPERKACEHKKVLLLSRMPSQHFSQEGSDCIYCSVLKGKAHFIRYSHC